MCWVGFGFSWRLHDRDLLVLGLSSIKGGFRYVGGATYNLCFQEIILVELGATDPRKPIP